MHNLLYVLLIDVLQIFDLWHFGHIFINFLEAFDETSQIHWRFLLVATLKTIHLIDLISAVILVMDCLILTTTVPRHHIWILSLSLIRHRAHLALIVEAILVLWVSLVT